MLADRIAGSLVTHEPGWLIPRPSQLARRYQVGTEEVHAAIDHLVARRIVRRAPDGQLYRSSPAEYLLSLEGITGLGGSVDPMSGNLTCINCRTGREPVPEEAAQALNVTPGERVAAIRLAWALDDVPAAVSTTYMARVAAEPRVLASWVAASVPVTELPLSPVAADSMSGKQHGREWPPCAVAIQMQPPSAAIARQLRIRTGQTAVLITVFSGDPNGRGPAVLTAAVLRPDMFRITVQSMPSTRTAGLLPAAWSLATADGGR
jgi:DNA-binding GntR family transcriptional regulator